MSGVCYLAGQLVSEYELTGDAGSPAASRRPLEEALTALRKGALLLKHGRHGRPKVHYFRVTGCDTLLRWRSASGSMKQVKLRSVNAVVAGQGSEVFRRHPVREAPGATRSLSLHYKDEEGAARTLDLTCANREQFELWHAGLRVLAHRLRTVGAPVAAAAGGAAGTMPPLGSASGTGGATPADVARCLDKSRALQRQASGGLGLAVPAAERTPCDLLAWGSAHRVPPAAASLRSVAAVQENCWQHRALPGPAPGAAWVDAYRAAVGRKHGAVISATGALYTWGEGRSGKLGLGHDQDQAQPQRVRHGLEGQCVVAAACGDDCTAALTAGGDLFMWGRLHVDSRPQLVPLHVRGDLRGRRIVQVSCGPFHCAAVTSEGQLFTWGEGFGGKLGHGDQGSRAQPALVQALAGWQVLEAACGVWHTAAIVVEGPAEGGSPFTQPHYSPLKLEAAGPADAVAGGSGEQGAGQAAGLPPASPVHHGAAHHNRNNSTSSAFSEASLVHEGTGGALYTWGGVNESVAFGSSEKHDSNKGCLGHGEVDLYRGQLLPTRVGGALEHRQVRHVAAGSHLTVAVTTGGRVYQMGVTGASVPAKHCFWEGATMPELVRGALQGYFVDEVACGMHHVMAVGRPLDRRTGRPADNAPRAAFAWGRGSEGQLGTKAFDDSPAPLLVEGLKGRSLLQVTCGGSNSMAVCEHSVQRWEPDSREEAEAASRTLYALMAEPKQLRIQAPGDPTPSAAASRRESERGGGGGGGGMALVRRSLSMMGARTSFREGGSGSVAGGALAQAGPVGIGGPPDLSRASSGSVRSLGGISAAGSGRGPSVSFSHYYTAPHGGLGAPRNSLQHTAQQHASAAAAARQLHRMRSDRTASSGLPGSEPSFQRVVSIGSPVKSVGGGWGYSHSLGGGSARRSTYAGAGSSHHMTSARSFTHSVGAARSDASSLSSWQHRPHSDDGRGGGAEHEVDSGAAGGAPGGSSGGVHRALSSSADLAAGLLDDLRSGSSSAALVDELAEKNRIIERLQRKLDKMQRQQLERPATAAAAAHADSGRGAEDRLRESVLLSAGAFRELQQQHVAASPASSQRVRPRTSPAGGAGARAPARRTSLSPTDSGGRGSAGTEAPGEPSLDERLLHSMEEMIRLKEVHLAGQQAKLQAWAAELQQREAALAAQQAQLASGGSAAVSTAAAAAASPGGSSWGGLGHRLEPIPSESPLLPAGRAATPSAPGSVATASPLPANLSPAVRRVLAEAMGAPPLAAATAAGRGGAPSSNGSVHGGGAGSSSVPGTVPHSPAASGEWTEELEQGVFLTFVSEAEGGAKRLKRIRFSRSLFTADSAKAWYEANKHRLAPNGTPCASGTAGSAPQSQPSTPGAAAAVAQQAAAEGGAQAPSAAAGVQSSLHYRQTSRNLSFDARELAAFHERLLAAREQQQQQQQPAHSPPGLPLGPQRPSRLSRAAAGPGGGSASLPDSPFAAAASGQAQQQQQDAFVTPRSGLEEGQDAAHAAAGDGSAVFRSAQSTPATALTSSRQAFVGPASVAESGGSSPIRASRSSGSPSTLSKQLSVPRGAELKATAGQQLFTPRAAVDKQPTGSSCSSGGQPDAQPPSSGLSGAVGRLRRSLGGGAK